MASLTILASVEASAASSRSVETWRVGAVWILGGLATVAVIALIVSVLQSDRARHAEPSRSARRVPTQQIVLGFLAAACWVAGWSIVLEDAHRLWYGHVLFSALLFVVLAFGVMRSIRRPKDGGLTRP